MLTIAFFCGCGGLSCDDFPNMTYVSPVVSKYHYPDIGAGQGVQKIGDKLYVFGDSDVGVVQELDPALKSTGWKGLLVNSAGEDIISHPVGIAYREGYPTFIGNSVGGRGWLYEIDWEQFKQDGFVEGAILRSIKMLDARSMSRPEYVHYDGEWLVAVAEYEYKSEGMSEILLLDPHALRSATRIDDPSAVRYRFWVSAYVQDMYWSDARSELVLIQNVDYTKGWRLTFIDLDRAVASNSGMTDAVSETRCYCFESELEGYHEYSDGREVFLTSEDVGYNLYTSADE